MKKTRRPNQIFASAALVLTSLSWVPPIATFAKRQLNTAVKPCNGVTARLTTVWTLADTAISVIERSTEPGQELPTRAATDEIADVTVELTTIASKGAAQSEAESHTVAVATATATITTRNHLRRRDL